LSAVVNINKILVAAFAPISFCQKDANQNYKNIKGAKNSFVQKAACKLTLLKLTPVSSVSFINILRLA